MKGVVGAKSAETVDVLIGKENCPLFRSNKLSIMTQVKYINLKRLQ